MLESRLVTEPWNRRNGGYIGPEPEGHYLIISWWEGDPAYTKANLIKAKERLAKAAGLDVDDLPSEPTTTGPWVLHVGGRFGRFQHVFIGPDSPKNVKTEAESILEDLRELIYLDEDLASELEYERAQKVWEMLSLEERLDTIKEANSIAGGVCISIFAARHDTVPCDAIGYGCLADL